MRKILKRLWSLQESNMAHFYVDADSIVFRAGCSLEDRYYVVLDSAGSVVGRFNKKSEATDAAVDGCTIVRHKSFKDDMDMDTALIVAKGRLKEVMLHISTHPAFSGMTVLIGGSGNFRKDLFDEYKGHRDDFSRPILEKELRDYLQTRYSARLCHGEEAEDVASYLSLSDRDSYVAHIDKDLNNTPGRHFNYVTLDEYILTPEQADLNLYRQILMGDGTDNIKGIPGIGAAKAAKLLPEYRTPRDMWDVVVNAYAAAGLSPDDAILTARLVHIRRVPDEMWSPPAQT
jgi:5'-3' exonuclease